MTSDNIQAEIIKKKTEIIWIKKQLAYTRDTIKVELEDIDNLNYAVEMLLEEIENEEEELAEALEREEFESKKDHEETWAYDEARDNEL